MSSQSPAPKVDRVCPHCGLAYTSERLDGLCPACLIANTLDEEFHDEGPAFWEDPPAKKNTPARTFSHFELLDELGRGGMGVVYRARDLNTERIVALKVLQAHHLDVPDLVLRFRSEVRAVSSLDHPYVLPIHEVGENEGIPFFSMKLTTGGSLAHSIGTYLGKPKEAAQLLAKVARGVQHAHERGILHRDLKPGNILIDAAGEPYVCDFGLAKWIEDDQKLTVTAAVLGTPHYIAPEQALGSKALTIAVDIYSLGAILYELLTGRPPFVGGTVLETLVASQEKSPDRPSSLAKNVPADLETICLKALEHNPSQRYATAGTFADDLENFVAGRPITARPVNAAEQLWRWAKRNPLPALLVVALFGTLVTIAVGSVEAGARVRKQLAASLVAQARASQLTGHDGQRNNSLAALRQAADIKPTPELRTLAITALSLLDLSVQSRWKVRENAVKQPIAFGADLAKIYVVSPANGINAVDLGNGSSTTLLTRGSSSIFGLIYSSNRFLAARCEDSSIQIWSTETHELVHTFKNVPLSSRGPRWAYDCSFSPAGTFFACSKNDKEISIFRTSDWTEAAVVPTDFSKRILSFMPDESAILIADMNSATGELRLLSNPAAKKSITFPAVPQHMDISPDGRFIAVGCKDYNIYVLHAIDLTTLRTFRGHRQDVTQVTFSHRGTLLASTSRDQTIRLWDLLNESPQVAFSGLGSETSLRFSDDDQRISATDDRNDAVILKVAGASRSARTISPPGPSEYASLVSSLDISSDSKYLATASWQTIAIYELPTFRLVTMNRTSEPTERSIRFLDEDKLLVTARARAPEVFEVSNTGLRKIDTPSLVIPLGYLLGSNSGDDLGFTSERSGLVKSKKSADSDYISCEEPIWDLVSDLKNDWIATASKTSSFVSIHSAKTHTRIHQISAGSSGILSLSADKKRLITTGSSGGIVWDTSDWKQLGTIGKPEDNIYTACYSPLDEVLAASTGDKILLLDPKTFQEEAVLRDQVDPSSKYRLIFSPDGKTLVAQGADNSLHIWDISYIREELKRLRLYWE